MKINIRTVRISRSKRLAIISAITLPLQAFVVSPSNSTQFYSIIDLGALDEIFTGTTISAPSKVNNSGLVAGHSLVRNSVSFTTHAFQWDPTTGTMQDLGSLPGTDLSHSADINDAGQVVGQSDNRAFLWDPTMNAPGSNPSGAWVIPSASGIKDRCIPVAALMPSIFRIPSS